MGARLPPVINEQMASIVASGDRLLTIMQRMLAEIWPEVDNMAATSNKLIEEVQPAMQYVPAGMKKQILELTDATSKIATLMQKNNPKLKALANQSLATQKAQLAVVASKIHDAQEIQENAGSQATLRYLLGVCLTILSYGQAKKWHSEMPIFRLPPSCSYSNNGGNLPYSRQPGSRWVTLYYV